MKSPAELFSESLTKWPEPMASNNLTLEDWREFASIYCNVPVERLAGNIGLSLFSVIESQKLTINDFQGCEGMFISVFNQLMQTKDLVHIKAFHALHGSDIVDWVKNDPHRERVKQVEFFDSIFALKEA